MEMLLRSLLSRIPRRLYRPSDESAAHGERLSAYLAIRVRNETFFWIQARGTSMLSVFFPGSLVRIEQFQPPGVHGQIAVYARHGKMIAHRIVGYSPDQNIVLLKGDTLINHDAPLYVEEIIGLVSSVRRLGFPRPIMPDVAAAWLSVHLGRWFEQRMITKLKNAYSLVYILAFLAAWPARRWLLQRAQKQTG